MLSRGRHYRPEQGSCVMEYVSVLAGVGFSDRPGCTHPRLGWLARQVNDRVDEPARGQLAVLAPTLIGTRQRHPAIPAVVYLQLARAGLAAAPRQRMLRDVAELAARHLDWHTDPDPRRRRPCQPLLTVDRYSLWGTVWAATGGQPAHLRDRLLLAALADAVTTARRVLGLAPMPTGLETFKPDSPGFHA